MTDSKYKPDCEYAIRYTPDDERKEFWDQKSKQSEIAARLQHIIQNTENPKTVKRCMKKLSIIAEREAAFYASIKRLEETRRTLYRCPICDEYGMIIDREVVGQDGFNGDDITIDDYWCLVCHYAH
jgi:hypothetical protein